MWEKAEVCTDKWGRWHPLYIFSCPWNGFSRGFLVKMALCGWIREVRSVRDHHSGRHIACCACVR